MVLSPKWLTVANAIITALGTLVAALNGGAM